MTFEVTLLIVYVLLILHFIYVTETTAKGMKKGDKTKENPINWRG